MSENQRSSYVIIESHDPTLSIHSMLENINSTREESENEASNVIEFTKDPVSKTKPMDKVSPMPCFSSDAMEMNDKSESNGGQLMSAGEGLPEDTSIIFEAESYVEEENHFKVAPIVIQPDVDWSYEGNEVRSL